MLRLLFICLLIFPFATSAQVMQGSVINAKTYKPIADVLVANKRTAESVYTDSLGGFRIEAAVGDLIFYYRLGYYTRRETTHITPGSTQVIALVPSDLALPEVQVRGNSYQMDSIERSIIYRKALRDASEKIETYVGFGIGFNGIFSKMASILTGREKKLKHFKNQFITGEQEKFIATRYNIAVVTKITGLTGEDAGRFMNAYPMPYDFARAASGLELQAWIRNNFKQYSNKGSQH